MQFSNLQIEGGSRESVKEKGLSGRGMMFVFLPGWLVLHCTTYNPRSPSFLFLFCLSQCEGVCGCAGLVSGLVEASGGIYGLFLATAAKSLLMQQVCRTHCVHHTASQ